MFGYNDYLVANLYNPILFNFVFAGDVNSVEVYFESGSESNDKIEVQQCSTLFSFVTF